jgi:hypothetical protein
MRGATQIGDFTTSSADSYGLVLNVSPGALILRDFINFSYLDSPATTSATTYKTQGACASTAAGSAITFQNGSLGAQMILLEIGA